MSIRISRRRSLALLALVSLVATTAGTAADASELAPELQPGTLGRAKAIRAEVNDRYGRVPGRRLLVTKPTATGMIESFTLLSASMVEARTVPAANGIWYGLCPARATCPYPRRFARPPADLLVRRMALDLAVRTFMETSADVVAVSLPTRQFTVLVVERQELSDLPTLARALRADPARAPAASLLRVVDQLTRPHVYVAIALEPTPSGNLTFSAYPRWQG